MHLKNLRFQLRQITKQRLNRPVGNQRQVDSRNDVPSKESASQEDIKEVITIKLEKEEPELLVLSGDEEQGECQAGKLQKVAAAQERLKRTKYPEKSDIGVAMSGTSNKQSRKHIVDDTTEEKQTGGKQNIFVLEAVNNFGIPTLPPDFSLFDSECFK